MKSSCITLPNGRGAFARGCLAPASRECKSRPKADFQSCRRDHISSCRQRYGCVRGARIPPTQLGMF
ncbi:hypothetical protein ES705_07856 [subsurface metagenome]|jgi:hypothetical protein